MKPGATELTVILRDATSRASGEAARQRLAGAKAALATLSCTIPVVIGFLVPALVLLDFALKRLDDFASARLLEALVTSITVSGLAAIVAVIFGLTLAYAVRSHASPRTRSLARLASLGYAIPGTVLAIGIMITLTGIDRSLGYLGNWSSGAVLSGTLVALVFAYTVRFLALAHGTLEAGFGRISPHMDMAARSLGTTRSQTLFRVHIFLLRPPVLAALLLVFVDVMKELPATLVLRPFDFDTLATLVYMRASLGQLEEAALPALMIILVGLVPVLIALMLLDTQHR